MSENPSNQFARSLSGIQTRLHGYIFSLVRDLSDTDDLFQQTATILWKKIDQYDPQRSTFLTWACGIARLEVMNFLRSRARKRLYFSDELNLALIQSFTEASDTEFELRKEALERCKANLRERDRLLVDECYAEKEGVKKVAKRLERSTQSVHNSLRRIRTALLGCIEKTMLQLSHPQGKPSPGGELP